MSNLLSEAVNTLGLSKVAGECGVSYQAVRKWEKNGFPRTEWTGETSYAQTIAAMSDGVYTAEQLRDSCTPNKAA